MGDLTKPQLNALRAIAGFPSGRLLLAGSMSYAPVKRLLRRRLIEKAGHFRDCQRYRITAAGRAALQHQEQPRG